jgi:hypothetical protein
MSVLITLDHRWTRPEWEGIKVLACLPGTAAPDHSHTDPSTDWRVFHFTKAHRPLAILQTVLDRLERHRQFAPGALLFSTTALDRATCTALRETVTADPYHSAVLTDDDARITQLVIGPGFTAHRMFVHFIRNLSPIDQLDVDDVLAQMQHYLGPTPA